MTTFFVLFDEFSQSYVRSGRDHDGRTDLLNCAKHFTSIWSAANFAKKSRFLECLTVKKIVLQ